MELFVLIIAAGAIFLFLALINAVHAALVKLNVKLWVNMNYPGAFRKAWPEDALKMVYTSKAAALGIHPLFFIMLGILVPGILLASSGGAEGRNFFQGAGEVMIAVFVIVFIIYVSKPLYGCLKQSLSQGTAVDAGLNLPEPLEMVQILQNRIESGEAGEMLPFYSLWHAFFAHDALTERVEHLGSVAASGAGIPAEAADKIRGEIIRLGGVYERLLGSGKIPPKIKKVIKKRCRQLSGFPEYKVAGEGKILFDCGACRQKLSVAEGFAGTKQDCPRCGGLIEVPAGDKTPAPADRFKNALSIVFILSAVVLLTGLVKYESSWGGKAAASGMVLVFISLILLAMTSWGMVSSGKKKRQ